MKKLITILSILGTATLFSCQPGKEQLKKNFINGCKPEAVANGIDAKLADEYCECSAEKAINGMTLSEITQMEKDKTNPELTAKLMELIQPCVDDLQQKVMSTMPNTEVEQVAP